ncbi:hypothetical protein C346_06804 [Cryptococcus neoformans D17-1]|nr:hypothetical protein C352_06840 [Cryptococcus neoformans var. grubii CHC193]OXG75369.1 hypothetical protein C346_06804 [Cryptococcus neoformans var. grubii D17-1]
MDARSVLRKKAIPLTEASFLIGRYAGQRKSPTLNRRGWRGGRMRTE